MARRAVRIGLWSLAGLAGLAVGAVVIFALTFDPASLKPRIVAAVRQATGRELTLAGPIRVGLSLQPTLTLQDVSLANPAGFSRPQMATLTRLDLKLALLPLLDNRLEVQRLVLEKPDVILETDAQGRPNWQFTPEPRPAAPASAPAGPGQKHAPTLALQLSDVRVEDGTLTWRDGRSGQSAVIGIASLHAGAASPEADLLVSMQASYQGTTFGLEGNVGGLARLKEANAAWPVRAHLEAAGATLDVEGAIGQPQQARGYRLKLAAKVPELERLAGFVPGKNLPPLRDISFAAQVTDAGRPLPDVADLSLHIGRSDLTGLARGLRLDKFDAVAAGQDQKLQITAEGSINDAPASLAGSLGAPSALLSGSSPVDVSVRALGSNVAIKGTTARLPDGRLSLQGQLTGDTIDLDSVLAAIPKAAPAAAGAEPQAAQAPAPPRAAAWAGVIPDTPIPFGRLLGADIDTKLNIAQVIWRGAAYRDVATRLALKDGNLRVDPFSAETPGGHVEGVLSADASQATPTVALKLRIPRLSAQSLLAALRQPAFMTGNLQLVADVRGAGATPHAIAASLDGSLGLAMTGGTLDNRMFGSALGSVLRAANILDLVGRGGASQVQCFAARLDATHGVATLGSLVLVSSLLTMDGSGTMNLGAETLDLHLRPQARVGGQSVVIPLRVSGSFRSQAVASDPAAAIGQNAGTIAGALVGKGNPLGIIAGMLGAKQLFGGAEVDCGGTRGTGAPQPTPQRQPKLPNLPGALQQLFR